MIKTKVVNNKILRLHNKQHVYFFCFRSEFRSLIYKGKIERALSLVQYL